MPKFKICVFDIWRLSREISVLESFRLSACMNYAVRHSLIWCTSFNVQYFLTIWKKHCAKCISIFNGHFFNGLNASSAIFQTPVVFVHLWSQGIGWIEINLIFAALSVKAITEVSGFQGRLHACMYVSEKNLEMFVLWGEISRDRLDQNKPDLFRAICKSNQEAASPPQRFQGWRIWFGSYQAFTMIPTFQEEEAKI